VSAPPRVDGVDGVDGGRSPTADPLAAAAADRDLIDDDGVDRSDHEDDDDDDEDNEDDDEDDVVVSSLPPPGPVTLQVTAGGGRLDACLAELEDVAALGVSRSRLKALIEAGNVHVEGAIVRRAATKLRGGERVQLTLPTSAPVELIAEDLPLTVVYDDDDLCVIDKPAGLVVHPGAGHPQGTLANALAYRFAGLSISGERRPGIVHRLDKDTSGLLVVAKNDVTLHALQAQFIARTIEKRYVAISLGAPSTIGVSLELRTGHRRADGDRRRFTTKDPPPGPGSSSTIRLAHTVVTTRAVRDQVAVVDVVIHTGRTHQIRAHLKDRGHPLVQDALYGGGHAERRLPPGAVREAVARLRRHALHACALSLTHPRSGERLHFTSALPDDLQAILDALSSP
jgi:23S rRNA pseudouridine1911/1915/1917 synthase